jgi:proteasome assembly chaperone 4
MSSKTLEESLSELQVGEIRETKSVQSDTSDAEVQVSCFTEDLHDVTLHFQIVKFSKQVIKVQKRISEFLFLLFNSGIKK